MTARHPARRLCARTESDRGATAVEYGLMVVLIAAVLTAAFTALGGGLDTSFTSTCPAIDGAGRAATSPSCP